MNFIYIIRPRSSIEAKLNVFKIGKTERNIIKRLDEYEKGSVLILLISVINCTEVESNLIEYLKKRFIQRIDFGREYFDAELLDIKYEVFTFCNNFKENEQCVEEIPADIKEIENFCNIGDIGFINLYCKNMKHDLICVDKESSKFYLFNKTNNLWDYLTKTDLQLHYMKNIINFVKPLIDYYKNKEKHYLNIKHIKQAVFYEKKYKNILKLSQIISSSKICNLIVLIGHELFDNEFLNKLDKNKHLMSIKNGIIELKSEQFRERTKEDYFSKERNISFSNDINLREIVNIENGYNYEKKINENLDIHYYITNWINNICYKTDSKKDIIKLKDVYGIFKCTDIFLNFKKEEKRKYNYKYFVKKFSENKYFAKYYRDQYENYGHMLFCHKLT